MERFIDPAFQIVGQNIGTQIWRIENFHPVALSESDYGKFYSGDSYIVLRTSPGRGGAYLYDIHFWIGKDSTQDEYGTAAIKTTELDELLGGKAIQHREIQGHESDKFLSYFKPCIVPLDGGFATGFKKYEQNYEIRLYVCRGNRIARMKQVPFRISSLNHDDVFILDTDKKIYQFNGATSSIQERAKALEVIPYLKDKFHEGRKCLFTIIEDGEGSKSNEFWGYFGGFSSIDEKAYDEGEITSQTNGPCIYSLIDGDLKLEECLDSKEKLESNKCYLVDCGTELFIWVGRQISVDDKKIANKLAEELLKKENRSRNTCLIRLVQGYETSSFKSKFQSWSQSTDLDSVKQESFNLKGAPKDLPFNEETPPLLKGNGKLEVWRINGSDKIVISKEEIGKFCSGDCYIILYAYRANGTNEEAYFLASWIGNHSVMDDQVVGSQLANSIWDELNGVPVHGRIYEGKEPPHFISLFQPMVLLKGGLSIGYKRSIEESKHIDRTYCSNGLALIQISNTLIHNNKAIQVHAVVESLCSTDCFLLQAGDALYIWQGKSSTIEQQKLAKQIAEFLKPGFEAKHEREGSESCVFWSFIEGKRNFAKRIKQEIIRDSHLFSFSLTNRKLEVSEIYNFSQDDLLTEDILILNTHAEVFIWIGRSVDSKESQKAFEFDIAQKYIDQAIRLEGLSLGVPVYKVTEGNEPSFFTSNFYKWDISKANVQGNSFEKKYKLLYEITRTFSMLGRDKSMKTNDKATRASKLWAKLYSAIYSSKITKIEIEREEEELKEEATFSYDQLKAHSNNPALGINLMHREVHLSDEDFEMIFSMRKKEFYSYPKWKQDIFKRKVDLF